MDQEKKKHYYDLLSSGDIYDCQDEELIAYQHALLNKMNQFNNTPDTEEGREERKRIITSIYGYYPEGLWIEPPIHSNWGLSHVHFGKQVYFNFNTTLVDDADIYIGDHVMFGPNVTIVTANHPVSPRPRKYQLEYNKPVTIKENVWVGANATILSGVTIGKNSIIGAGSLVLHDVPDNVIVIGSPARILRKITIEDDVYYDHGKKIPPEILEKYR